MNEESNSFFMGSLSKAECCRPAVAAEPIAEMHIRRPVENWKELFRCKEASRRLVVEYISTRQQRPLAAGPAAVRRHLERHNRGIDNTRVERTVSCRFPHFPPARCPAP